MSVRAKFRVDSVEDVGGETATIKLSPVVGGSKENDSFFKWTPFGSIVLGTINKEAAAVFVVGKTYYVDFTPTE